MMMVTISSSEGGRALTLRRASYADFLQDLSAIGSQASNSLSDGVAEDVFFNLVESEFMSRCRAGATILPPTDTEKAPAMPLWPRVVAVVIGLLAALVIGGEIVNHYVHGPFPGVVPVKVIDGPHIGLSGNIVSTPHAFNGWNTLATVNVPADAVEIRRRYGGAGSKYVAELLKDREAGVGPRMWVRCWHWQLRHEPKESY